jgi:hypothetical protein
VLQPVQPAAPRGAQSPAAARAGKQRSYTPLRAVLGVLCLGLIAFGAWQIPKNFAGQPDKQESSSKPGKKTDDSQIRTFDVGPLSDEQKAAFEAMEAELFDPDEPAEAESREEIYPAGHDYEWFYADSEGWYEGEEEEGEAK